MKKEDLKNLIKEVIRESDNPILNKLGFKFDGKSRYTLDLANGIPLKVYFDSSEGESSQFEEFSKDTCDVSIRVDVDDNTYIASVDFYFEEDGAERGRSSKPNENVMVSLKEVLSIIIKKLKYPMWGISEDYWVDMTPTIKPIAGFVKKIK